MKSIQVKSIEFYSDDQRVTEWAVNDSGEGLFTRRHDGTWHQCAGTSQFRAKSPKELMRKVRRDRYFEDEAPRMVRGSAKGWD